MSIVFIGTPQFAVPSLRRLVEEGYTLSAAVTQPARPAGRGRRLRPPPVEVAARELGIPVLQPASLRDDEAVAQIAALKPRVMVAVAYGQILRRRILDIPERGVLNVHPSLLPRWRGASPIPAAIIAGDAETGVTIILMDEGMDSGPILSQARVPIGPEDTTGSLTATLAGLSADLLIDTLPRWLNAEIVPQPQEESLATRAPLLRKEDGRIDWTLPAEDIWRRVRAYNPWPGAHTYLDGELVHIWRAWPVPVDFPAEPGSVVSLKPADTALDLPVGAREGFVVQTGRGALIVLEAQRPGRRSLPAAEFARGLPGLEGRRFL
jgi:methionyl-tRNA formyltransferase